MKQFILQILVLLVIIFGGIYLAQNPAILNSLLGKSTNNTSGLVSLGQQNVQSSGSTKRLALLDSNGSIKTTILVEIASNQKDRAKGLGGRTSLDSSRGMLFIFDRKGKPTFWMKGMKIPLDFIWVSDDRIVDILPNINPPAEGVADTNLSLYTANVEFNKVLEVNAGFVSTHNIQVGDKIKFVE